MTFPVWLQARGGSMRPFLRPGDVLAVDPSPAQGYRRGDIALYGEKDDYALHRLYRRCEGGWWAADDAGTLPFHRVPDAALRGRLTGGAPQGWTGLAAGALCRIFFIVARSLKRGARVLRASARPA